MNEQYYCTSQKRVIDKYGGPYSNLRAFIGVAGLLLIVAQFIAIAFLIENASIFLAVRRSVFPVCCYVVWFALTRNKSRAAKIFTSIEFSDDHMDITQDYIVAGKNNELVEKYIVNRMNYKDFTKFTIREEYIFELFGDFEITHYKKPLGESEYGSPELRYKVKTSIGLTLTDEIKDSVIETINEKTGKTNKGV